MSNVSYYGGFRTRTFSDIFPGYTIFKEKAEEVKQQLPYDVQNLAPIFYLLYARYGNSHISFSDENQFIYALFSVIFMYGPSWEKRLSIQKALRDLSTDEILTGAKAIHNHSYNPGTEPSTDTIDELPTINEQNTTKYQKNILEAYSELYQLIETDVTEDFLDKFKKLFIQVLAPDMPLLYETYPEDSLELE